MRVVVREVICGQYGGESDGVERWECGIREMRCRDSEVKILGEVLLSQPPTAEIQ